MVHDKRRQGRQITMWHHVGRTCFSAIILLCLILHNAGEVSGQGEADGVAEPEQGEVTVSAGEEDEWEEAPLMEGVMDDEGETSQDILQPTVMVATLVRNKAQTLPYFLYYLENLDYPKHRISLWFVSDHNVDNSSQMLQSWLSKVQHLYHDIYFHQDDSQTGFPDAAGPVHWSKERFTHVINLRQTALRDARRIWADYLLMLDADAILMNNQTLNRLIEQRRTIVAPMLNTTANDYYANFWGAMDSKGYYKRSKDYFNIREREIEGLFTVAMVHSALLINLRHSRSEQLAYHPPPKNYRGPFDDIIIFAFSAKYYGIEMHLLNDDFFGYLPYPMEAVHTLSEEAEQFVHIKVESIIADIPLQHVPYLEPQRPTADKMGFDQVYMINLKRRPDRREKMARCFTELSISPKYVDAVDGKLLNQSYIENLGVKMLPGYADPYHGRPLTSGEIGCFLSHYFIWKDVLDNNYDKILVFEDDIRFEPFFRRKVEILMFEVNRLKLDWDLIYLGRKKLKWQDEDYVEGTDLLVHPNYSYWTLSYMVTRQGVEKLMSHKPLQHLLPVDEYIPILFGQHPEEKWKNQFYPRDLKGYSSEPLLVYPTHYTGEPGYFTDTDHSEVINFGQDGFLIKGEETVVTKEEGHVQGQGQGQGLVNDPTLLLKDTKSKPGPDVRGDGGELKDEL